MAQRRDIYTKSEKSGPIAFEQPPPPPPPPHRKAIILLLVMLVLLAGVAGWFNEREGGEDSGEFDHLLIQPVSTNAFSATNRPTSDIAAVESLLTDLGGFDQPPPPTLSPQKMSEAMAYVRSAQQYIRSRDMDGAERETLKALEVWPNMNMAVRLLGSIYTQRGQFDQAVVVLEKALAHEPFSAETINNLAINYMQKGMMGRAEELLVTSLQIRPDYAVAYINLGFIQLRIGQYDHAVENFELGLKQLPDNPGVLNNLAVCLIRLGDYATARKKLNDLITMAPNRAPAYFNMAISYVMEQNFDAALEWISRGSDFCTPSQLQSFLADSDFDSIRSYPAFQQIINEQFPDIPSRPPSP